MSELTVLLLGSTDRPEFAEARNVLDGLARVIPAADVDAAGCPCLADEEIAVDVIVVAQAYPGQFSGEALDRLSRLAPLARVVGLLGSWCEGEVRSGRPWPGAVRVYWHQWPARCHQELGRLRQGLCIVVVPAADGRRRGAVSRAGRPAMAPARRADRDPLSSRSRCGTGSRRACRRAGYSTVAGAQSGDSGRRFAQPVGYRRPRRCIRRGPGRHLRRHRLPRRGTRRSEALTAAVRPAPVIVLMSFPRVEDRDRVLAAGAAACSPSRSCWKTSSGRLSGRKRMTKEEG